MLQIVRDVKESPFYKLNMMLLRLAFGATLVAALGVFLLQGGTVGRQLSFACVCLAFLFACLRRWVLPAVRETWQLDLVVLAYHLLIYMVQWYSVWATPELETPGGIVCLIAVTGLLITSDVLFVAAVLFCGASWLTVRHYAGAPLTSHLILQLMVMASVASAVIRVAVLRMYKSLGDARLREIQNAEELRRAARRLQEETARRQESELRLLQAQKNESLGILAAGVAHDFNNCLLAISAFAENLEITSKDELSRQSASRILTAVEHASGICCQMLTYAGKSSGLLHAVGLCELVREATQLLRASVPARVNLMVECEAETGSITGNETQLQQVLMNLVSNAAEAIDGQGTVEVSVSNLQIEDDLSNVPDNTFGAPLRPGKYVCLRVSDTGCGVSDELSLQMFDPYFTTKESGHGFGLSTVLGIVRSHKATMTVDSAIEKGTLITVMFPSEGMSFADSSQFRIPRQAADSAVAKADRRILVVDDDELVRTPLAKMLTLLDWDVEEVSSGFAAVETLRSGKQFGVLLIDFMMPGLNGYQTLKAIRECGCDAPAILCSGYVAGREEESIVSEFDEYLPKPFQRRELEEKLAAVQGVSEGN